MLCRASAEILASQDPRVLQDVTETEDHKDRVAHQDAEDNGVRKDVMAHLDPRYVSKTKQKYTPTSPRGNFAAILTPLHSCRRMMQ